MSIIFYVIEKYKNPANLYNIYYFIGKNIIKLWKQ